MPFFVRIKERSRAYLCAMKILMVCLGNICRSPLAEGILQEKAKKAGLDWLIDSAGTNGFHTGESPHPLSQKVARLNGIDISKQVARRFTRADLEHYDKIYVMAADVWDDVKKLAAHSDTKNVEFFLDSLFPGENRDVPDPWYGTEPGYHEVYSLIDKACDAIIARFKASNNQQKAVYQNV